MACLLPSLPGDMPTGRLQAQSNSIIRQLQRKRAALQNEINKSEKLITTTKQDVRTQLTNLAVLNGQIDERKRYISGIETDMNTLDGQITLLQQQLKNLQGELDVKKAKYKRSMAYMSRNKTIQNQLLFVLSAGKVTQMFRRLRYVREYANYQRAQGEQIEAKQMQVMKKRSDLQAAKGEKNALLLEGQQARAKLEVQQHQNESIVSDLQKRQRSLLGEVARKKKQSASLNAQIDRLIAQEIAAAKKRAEAEARKKAASRAAADAQRRAAAVARRKAAAAAAAENARQVAAAKAEQKRAEARAEAAAKKAAARAKAKADAKTKQLAADAENAQRAAEQARAKTAQAKAKQASDARIASTPVAEAAPVEYANDEDRRLNGSFEANRGRLPAPITGSYLIGGHFGSYNVPGLKGVTLDNKGTNFIGHPGAKARSIFNGEVSAVFQFGGLMNVLVRHGSYISVYCNLSSVSVARGQHVGTGQILGSVADSGGGNCILQFQLRKETAKLNPESWIGH
jgi:septal ring factor EnvC (AmiA/AmiB activator)